MNPPEENFIINLDWVLEESRKSSGVVSKLLEVATLLEPGWNSKRG